MPSLAFHVQWDTYRTLYPLMSLHDSSRFAQIVRAMINIQQNEGNLITNVILNSVR
jgi:putative alpha-1,2-mannosidase